MESPNSIHLALDARSIFGILVPSFGELSQPSSDPDLLPYVLQGTVSLCRWWEGPDAASRLKVMGWRDRIAERAFPLHVTNPGSGVVPEHHQVCSPQKIEG